MHPAVAIGNLPPGMNRWRIAGLIVAVALAAWLVLRSCAPEPEPAVVVPPPPREQFHTSKPLQLAMASTADPAASEWLERELRYLLIRGRMQVAGPDQPNAFTLRVELPQAPQTKAKLTLLAPDDQPERETEIDLGAAEKPGKLDTVQTFARALPRFLGADNVATDWTGFIGTEDGAAYDTFIRSSDELLGTSGRGFTQLSAPERSPAVERLESLVRRHRDFARAVALLSVGYLSLGGEDEASLIRIADTTAERALGIDPALTNARSAIGLVRLRRGEWAGAMEHFNAALAIDANSVPALEGLACLLVDVGHASAALPIAQRAVALQPASIGANECLAYAQLATNSPAEAAEKPASDPLAVAQAKAMSALLSGDANLAQRTLRSAKGVRNAATWVDPLLQAAADRRKTSQALQAITRAASERLIDPVTEVVCGAALRQSDFVFNRMLRLHRQNDSVPLRILWLPQTDFLRQHARFEEIAEAAALLPFWQDHGSPDVCAQEPDVYGCKLRAAGTAPKAE